MLRVSASNLVYLSAKWAAFPRKGTHFKAKVPKAPLSEREQLIKGYGEDVVHFLEEEKPPGGEDYPPAVLGRCRHRHPAVFR